MQIDVVLNPAEIALLPSRDLSATTCVVFDILRATSSMVTALAHGAQDIRPVRTIGEALALKKLLPGAALGGERHGEKIEGFQLGNSPLEYRKNVPAQIITTTTNGTIGLRACDGGKETLAAAILNLAATCNRIAAAANVLLVCAGTFETLAAEDVLAAGMLCAEFPGATLTDSAEIALGYYSAHKDDILSALVKTRNGRALIAKGRGAEIDWCAQCSIFNVVGVQKDGRVAPAQDQCIG
jgi:2-phosphosulfolactate phosphatase